MGVPSAAWDILFILHPTWHSYTHGWIYTIDRYYEILMNLYGTHIYTRAPSRYSLMKLFIIKAWSSSDSRDVPDVGLHVAAGFLKFGALGCIRNLLHREFLSDVRVQRILQSFPAKGRSTVEILSYDTHQDWEALLPQALFAIRTAVSKSIGLAPYQLLFGRDASQPIDIVFGKPPMHRKATLTTTGTRNNYGAGSTTQKRTHEKKSHLP
jgi:hypothetical protein